jgi:hypothetical protein
LNEMLWKMLADGAGRVPVRAITMVPAGPETWLWPVPIDTTAANSTNTGTSRTIAARRDDNCFTRKAYYGDFSSRLG